MESLRLEPLERPPIFPDGVTCFAARIPGGHRLHFAAGRECAARAMSALGLPPVAVPRGAAGEPVWPTGLTGSITHKREYVSAAVARTSELASVGIDAEEIMDEERAARIARVVMLPEESVAGGNELPPGLRVSLLFSIKEALFKCLYPLVRTRFYYEAAMVTELDLTERRFVATLTTDLSPAFGRTHTLGGAFFIDDCRVHAGAWIRPDERGRTDGPLATPAEPTV